jgi:hypothetical protein
MFNPLKGRPEYAKGCHRGLVALGDLSEKTTFCYMSPEKKTKKQIIKKRGRPASQPGRSALPRGRSRKSPAQKKRAQKKREETAIQKIVNHYFKSKGLSLEEIKDNAKKKKIIYSRYTRPAKQLLELAGSLREAKKAITKVAKWAKSRDLDYAIETVFKKWLELDRLKPKEIVKKPFYGDDPMVWSETRKKWYVIIPDGDWKEFAGQESDIEWRISK